MITDCAIIISAIENIILLSVTREGGAKPVIDPMQLMRISEHPIDISDNLIIYDDLEHGTLRIYEQIGSGPVTVQQLTSQFSEIRNAVKLAEVTVNSIWKKEEVFIWKISYEYGHENLVIPMINQVLHFANFYDQYESVVISDTEYERLFPYAEDVLKDFQKVNRKFEYWLDKHEEE